MTRQEAATAAQDEATCDSQGRTLFSLHLPYIGSGTLESNEPETTMVAAAAYQHCHDETTAAAAAAT
jgi:hypothetical protein